MEKIINDNSEFWTYCGIKIPINIKNVPSIDGVNIYYSDGTEPDMFGMDDKRLTLKEYQNKSKIIR